MVAHNSVAAKIDEYAVASIGGFVSGRSVENDQSQRYLRSLNRRRRALLTLIALALPLPVYLIPLANYMPDALYEALPSTVVDVIYFCLCNGRYVWEAASAVTVAISLLVIWRLVPSVSISERSSWRKLGGAAVPSIAGLLVKVLFYRSP